jgi:hypothetical protein
MIRIPVYLPLESYFLLAFFERKFRILIGYSASPLRPQILEYRSDARLALMGNSSFSGIN